MILTLTVNPAIDRNFAADRLVFEDRGYILASSMSAGGRGINASRVIHAFGGKTTAIVTSGGKSGQQFEQLLADSGFPIEVVHIKHGVRHNLTITDRTGLTVKLNEIGPRLDAAEVARVERAVSRSLPEARWLMLCGSVPPGVPTGFYSTLIAKAREKGVKTLLDTDGEALREGIEAGPTVVAPNRQEAERLLGEALVTRKHSIDAVSTIRRMGAESVVLSLGSRGAVAASEQTVVEMVPPRIDAVSPIGSGDVLAAAFVWAMDRNNDFVDALRWGVAAGTASATLPGVEFASMEQTKEVYSKVEPRIAS
ncbi:MAG: 1-phosphofructokinase family hexose kinase [Bryobacteraceae bacterium]